MAILEEEEKRRTSGRAWWGGHEFWTAEDEEDDFPLIKNIGHILFFLGSFIGLIFEAIAFIRCVKQYHGSLERTVFIGFTIVMIISAVVIFAMLLDSCFQALNRIFGSPSPSYTQNDIEKGVQTEAFLPGSSQFPCVWTSHKSCQSYSTDRVGRLVEEISRLSKEEVAELSSILVKTGLNEHPLVGVTQPGVAGVAGVAMKVPIAVEEKKVENGGFDLKLESCPSSFLSQIRTACEIYYLTELGIHACVDLLYKAPVVFKNGVSKEEGEQIIQKFRAIGAKIAME